jgi:hypothetical protein
MSRAWRGNAAVSSQASPSRSHATAAAGTHGVPHGTHRRTPPTGCPPSARRGRFGAACTAVSVQRGGHCCRLRVRLAHPNARVSERKLGARRTARIRAAYQFAAAAAGRMHVHDLMRALRASIGALRRTARKQNADAIIGV